MHAADYPEAAETVNFSMYVDDVLDSCETVEEAKHLQHQLSDLLSMASFTLRKWSSNEAAVVEDIPVEDRLPSLEIHEEGTPKIKTLFDPLQFLSLFTMRAKVLMQELWLAGTDWDDVLPEDLTIKCKAKWVSELTDLSRIAIPRCLRLANPEKVDLHLFSDASKAAFASSANLVCQYPDNSRSSRLIASKCRVAPVKALTIPRLELIVAVLSSRLAQSILKVLTVDRTIFWTNSENVWFWVRSQSREFKPFIANRIGEIQPIASPEQWRHVPGTSNSADLPTRGWQLSAKELTDSKFWMEGPTFLEGDESAWPSIPPTGDTKKCDDLERLKITSAHLTYANPSINPVEFSSLKHLVRVTGSGEKLC